MIARLLESIPHDKAGDELFLCLTLMVGGGVGILITLGIAAVEIAIADYRARRAERRAVK
jgi:hypothetical protein